MGIRSGQYFHSQMFDKVVSRWTGVTCSSGVHPGRVVSLHLQGLSLVGTISPLLGNLTNLRMLDLSDNKLEGPIPEFLESFQLLKNLNLSFNNLSGPVPDRGGLCEAENEDG
ncbi:hypothetical protein E2562_031879 [Oryza meyeriana var. granulata]|uniref:Leucine-rich repeat-containing N-terminal plant-type domain-containing protein n=1 Tax=Oryza meyeriana var. granulata TaxID=110450 RepID=A0A6G1F042_9ORYZ|nr:hypothetical protein E2562_031879 [Oryza meyeriana var. granulata]